MIRKGTTFTGMENQKTSRISLEDQKNGEQGTEHPQWLRVLQFFISLLWIGYQFYILFHPGVPMVQRPVHVAFAVSLVFLFRPLQWGEGKFRHVLTGVDLGCAVMALVIGGYFVYHADRIQSRIVFFDDFSISEDK